MTSSTNIQRGLDTPVLVYSLLEGHPASTALIPLAERLIMTA
jgi:hypothetical protein